jgi:hypothetical protein
VTLGRLNTDDATAVRCDSHRQQPGPQPGGRRPWTRSFDFDDAELHADAERLEALLTDDFQSIGERGFVLDKAQWIARHGDFRYVSLQTTDADVRRYPGTAILRCVQRSDATWQGKPMTLKLRVGQVWVKLPGGWKLAAIQFSSLAAG